MEKRKSLASAEVRTADRPASSLLIISSARCSGYFLTSRNNRTKALIQLKNSTDTQKRNMKQTRQKQCGSSKNNNIIIIIIIIIIIPGHPSAIELQKFTPISTNHVIREVLQ